jgi:hypothetical protein
MILQDDYRPVILMAMPAATAVHRNPSPRSHRITAEDEAVLVSDGADIMGQVLPRCCF